MIDVGMNDEGMIEWTNESMRAFVLAIAHRYEELYGEPMTIMDHVKANGQPRGRAVPPLPEFTAKDSGITVRIRKVGPATQQRIAEAIMREYPEPAPPMIATELGEKSNPADPDHIAAVAKWEKETTSKLNERILRMAMLEAEVTIDDQARIEIARRKRSLELSGAAWSPDERMTPEEDDRLFYMLHVVCATRDDLQEFAQAATQRSVPTEEAVQRHIATFPGAVSGPGRVSISSDPAIGDQPQPDA